MSSNIEEIKNEMQEHILVANATLNALQKNIEEVGEVIKDAILNKDKKLLICGNGGSAADSQHFAAELAGRYKKERKGLSAIALSTDTSALTAIGNDFGFEFIFGRQVEALAKEGDIVFGISTSGNSYNIINAFNVAKEIGCKTVALSGNSGGEMRFLADYNLVIPSENTPRIQEMHIFIIHNLCRIIES